MSGRKKKEKEKLKREGEGERERKRKEEEVKSLAASSVSALWLIPSLLVLCLIVSAGAAAPRPSAQNTSG